MRLILFRHAEKSISADRDPSLNNRGQSQAQKIIEMVSTQELFAPSKIYSSPKKRSQETLLPVAKILNLEVQLKADLDERTSAETSREFLQRIRKTLDWIQSQTGEIYIVTHFDWIAEALAIVHSDINLNEEHLQNWSAGQFMEFEITDNHWQFKKLGRVTI